MARGTETADTPLVLIVPGLENSGPDHWQSLWERDDEHCHRVDLTRWDRPHRNTWVNQLNLAIHKAVEQAPRRPIVLAAHSLGCHVVAWWAKLEGPAFAETGGSPVAGALMVAPPEVDFFPRDERLTPFAPTPAEPLPFASTLVASRDDPWISFGHARRLARDWGSELVDVGQLGHINADSDLGHWPEGRRLLARLTRDAQGSEPAVAEAIRAAPSQGLVQGAAAPAG